MEKNTNYVTIKCPHCGAEYTLAEIFLPKYLLGKSNTVVKDLQGKILYVEWDEEPDLTEKYICDYCNKEFAVNAEVKAKVVQLLEEETAQNVEDIKLF